MDNFSIDLDAVLDEFELKEDQAENTTVDRGQDKSQSVVKSQFLSDQGVQPDVLGNSKHPSDGSTSNSVSDQSSSPSRSADFHKSQSGIFGSQHTNSAGIIPMTDVTEGGDVGTSSGNQKSSEHIDPDDSTSGETDYRAVCIAVDGGDNCDAVDDKFDASSVISGLPDCGAVGKSVSCVSRASTVTQSGGDVCSSVSAGFQRSISSPTSTIDVALSQTISSTLTGGVPADSACFTTSGSSMVPPVSSVVTSNCGTATVISTVDVACSGPTIVEGCGVGASPTCVDTDNTGETNSGSITACAERSDSATVDITVTGVSSAIVEKSDNDDDISDGIRNQKLLREGSAEREHSHFPLLRSVESCDISDISDVTIDAAQCYSPPSTSIYQIAYPCEDESLTDLSRSPGGFEQGPPSNIDKTVFCQDVTAMETEPGPIENEESPMPVEESGGVSSTETVLPDLVMSEESSDAPEPDPIEESSGDVASRLLRHHSIECDVRTTTDSAETCVVPERPDSLDVTPFQSASESAAVDQSSAHPVSAAPVLAPTVSTVSAPVSPAPPAVQEFADCGEAPLQRTGGSIVTAPGAQSGSTGSRTQLGSTAAGRGPVTPGRLTSSSTDDSSLGRVAPVWVPDDEMDSCMSCELKFTLVRRRHHCRACGRLLCAVCCCQRARLEFMDMREARVCSRCLSVLERVQQNIRRQNQSVTTTSGVTSTVEPVATTSASDPAIDAPGGAEARMPNPNNPLEYCSTVPPLEQADVGGARSPLSVMVPCSALRRPPDPATPRTPGGSKQVMFSDGIRPGGDLTEPQGHPGSSQHQRAQRPSNRGGSKSRLGAVATLAATEHAWCSQSDQLPPFVQTVGNVECGDISRLSEQAAADLLRTETSSQWAVQVNNNLLIHTSFVKLDCCVGAKCWVFSSDGLRAVGQDEVVLVLQCDSDTEPLPRDVFVYYRLLYIDAASGKYVGDLGHTLVSNHFLGFREHGAFLYARPTLQCLQSLPVTDQPYLVALLIHKWEVPWAKVFPLRLLLRLGAEFRYYPCPVVSVRSRKPVFFEIGQTIINLLADFRNYTYVLPTIPGMHIHMEDKRTSVLLPRNRFNQVSKTINNSGEHVLAFGACFSQKADSHLVCVQSEEGRYQTQAINIHSRPRQVTGASFVVFNGALKSSLNLTAKSSIVEDGLMYQISPESMASLRERLRKMEDVTIECGPVDGPVEETLSITWVEDDLNYNMGVTSVIDGRSMDSVMSMRVHSGSEYTGNGKIIRWTEVFLLQGDEPSEFSRLSEALSRGTCHALLPLLSDVCEQKLSPLALRATVDSDTVCYEAGSGRNQLPAEYMKQLDSELVPILHLFAARGVSQPICVELVFYVLHC